MIASSAELDPPLTLSTRTLLPVFATFEPGESLSALFVGARFALTKMLEHVLRVNAIVLADHACDIFAVETSATTKHQDVVFDVFAPRTDEVGTFLGEDLYFAFSTFYVALGIVLTVHAFVGRRVVLDLLVLVLADVTCREDVTELAWVKGTCPLRRVVVLEFEGLVEHLSYASNAHGTAIYVDAGVVAKALAATVAAPYGSHREVLNSVGLQQEVERRLGVVDTEFRQTRAFVQLTPR